MNKTFRATMLAGVSVCALLSAGPASAQQSANERTVPIQEVTACPRGDHLAWRISQEPLIHRGGESPENGDSPIAYRNSGEAPMQTECSPTLFEFEPVERHKVVAGFDGGIITSDAGGLLLGRLDRGLGLIRRMASCFTDRRDPRLLEHTVETLVGQRVFALALGYEDLNDHDELRHARCSMCWPASSRPSVRTVRRWPARARSTGWSGRGARPGSITRSITMRRAWKPLFVDIFLDGHKRAPKEIVLDLDATDDTIHGEQEGRFFHGYYAAIATPLYIFCGRFLLGAKLRPANIDGAAGAVDEVPGSRPHPGPLAEGADRAARRFGLLPRGADGVVRGRGCPLTCSAWRPTRA